MVKSAQKVGKDIFPRVRWETGLRLNKMKAHMQGKEGLMVSNDRAINALLDTYSETEGIAL